MYLISVIIPFHREIQELITAVSSVNLQYLPQGFGFQIIIGNDSKYSNQKITKSLENNCNLKYELIVARNKNMHGAGNSRNTALEMATGNYIAFLDSDDVWAKHKTLMQLNILLSGADFVSCGYKIKDSVKKFLPPHKNQIEKNIFFSSNSLGTSTIIGKSEVILKCRFTNIKFCQDLLFWYQVFKETPHLSYQEITDTLVEYSPHGRTANGNALEFINYYLKACKKAKLRKMDINRALFSYILRGIKNKVHLLFIDFINIKFFKTFKKNIKKRSLLNPLFYFYYLRENIIYDLKNKTNTFLRLRFNNNYKKKHSSSVHYVPSNSDIVELSLCKTVDFIKRFGLPFKKFQFVDLGSGKGKVVSIVLRKFPFLASFYPPLGIEISPDLCDIARYNLKKLKAQYKIINIDCKETKEVINSEDLIIYLYNPFGADLLYEIISNLNNCKSLFIIYVEPIHESILDELGFVKVFEKCSFSNLKNRSFSIFYKLNMNYI